MSIGRGISDEGLTIIKRESVSAFHDTLNSVDSKISFTIETENNGQIAFLDTLVTRKDGIVIIDVYRKATHTDRYLDYSPHYEKRHKIGTVSTLLNRAFNLPSTTYGKSKEIQHVTNALKANGYPWSIISNILKKKKKPPTQTIPRRKN